MTLRPLPALSAVFLLAVLPFSHRALAQADATVSAGAQDAPAANFVAKVNEDLPDAPIAPQQSGPTPSTAPPSQNPPVPPGEPQGGKQTKRILYIVPNFRAVSSDQKLPPQTVKEKFTTAALDSVDYSSFIFVAGQAGVNQARKATPEFRQGAAGYGRYFWHTYADTVDENLWVEFLYPVLLHQDSRFYTLNKGGFVKRLAYSATRVVITRTDGGHETVNAAEILGAGTAAGISNTYYPSQERSFTKVYQRWITSMAIDGATFVFKEFWPTLNDKFFHQKD